MIKPLATKNLQNSGTVEVFGLTPGSSKGHPSFHLPLKLF